MEGVCRTCLRAPTQLLPLYGDELLINKIEAISSISLIFSDEYPGMICGECVINVNKLYNFRKVIINNDQELRDTNRVSKEAEENTINLIEDVKIEPELHYTEPETTTKSSRVYLAKSNNCHICGKVFPSRIAFSKHRRTAHPPHRVCNICGIVVRRDNLSKHLKMHSSPPVSCKICDKVLKNEESLRGHERIHQGLTWTCATCERVFKVKSDYTRHVKRHLGPEMAKRQCSICGKNVRLIRKHMLTHTGERPYLCLHCNKVYTTSYALKVHIRRHTNETPFSCDLCSLSFRQKVSLTAHIKSKHVEKRNKEVG